MQFKNTNNHYGIIAIFFHWLMAILIIGLIIVGLYMVELPINLEKLKLYGWHKEYGMLVLLFAILRLIWRLTQVRPSLRISYWEVIAARSVHWAFYFCMFAMPLTGWMQSSAAGLSVSFLGLFVLPDLVSASSANMQFFQIIHNWLGYALIALIVLHTGAALKHHFVNKDDILRRMIS